MQKRHALFYTLLGSFSFSVTEALACSICVTALADSIMPPIFLWSLIATTWFFINGVVRSKTNMDTKWGLKVNGSFIMVFACFLAAGAYLGLGVCRLLEYRKGCGNDFLECVDK